MHTRFSHLFSTITASLFLVMMTGRLTAQDYLNHEALSEQVNALAQAHEACHLEVIGSSRQGRGLFLLTLASDPGASAGKPALLITAGLDGRHLVGTETALRVAGNLLENHADLLEAMTIYIIPRVNPDGR
jgi:murein tripeptide amidase MpaA